VGVRRVLLVQLLVRVSHLPDGVPVLEEHRRGGA
jgi:hypothetical protein